MEWPILDREQPFFDVAAWPHRTGALTRSRGGEGAWLSAYLVRLAGGQADRSPLRAGSPALLDIQPLAGTNMVYVAGTTNGGEHVLPVLVDPDDSRVPAIQLGGSFAHLPTVAGTRRAVALVGAWVDDSPDAPIRIIAQSLVDHGRAACQLNHYEQLDGPRALAAHGERLVMRVASPDGVRLDVRDIKSLDMCVSLPIPPGTPFAAFSGTVYALFEPGTASATIRAASIGSMPRGWDVVGPAPWAADLRAMRSGLLLATPRKNSVALSRVAITHRLPDLSSEVQLFKTSPSGVLSDIGTRSDSDHLTVIEGLAERPAKEPAWRTWLIDSVSCDIAELTPSPPQIDPQPIAGVSAHRTLRSPPPDRLPGVLLSSNVSARSHALNSFHAIDLEYLRGSGWRVVDASRYAASPQDWLFFQRALEVVSAKTPAHTPIIVEGFSLDAFRALYGVLRSGALDRVSGIVCRYPVTDLRTLYNLPGGWRYRYGLPRTPDGCLSIADLVRQRDDDLGTLDGRLPSLFYQVGEHDTRVPTSANRLFLATYSSRLRIGSRIEERQVDGGHDLQMDWASVSRSAKERLSFIKECCDN